MQTPPLGVRAGAAPDSQPCCGMSKRRAECGGDHWQQCAPQEPTEAATFRASFGRCRCARRLVQCPAKATQHLAQTA